MLCIECNLEHPHHRMDCSSKSKMEALHWVLGNLQYISYEALDEIAYKINVELTDRKFRDLFDVWED